MGDLSSDDIVIPRIIVGLGNPGKKYERTRHNVGFDAVNHLAHRWQISMTEHRRFNAHFGEGFARPGMKVALLKPLTYMNRSGQSIRAALDWFKLEPQSVLVIYDDMALPMGRIRIRLSGSAGGHNGVKSAIAHLNSQDFPRLRIGIGPPSHPADHPDKQVVSHVLGRFSAQETTVISDILEWVGDAVALSVHKGVNSAMNLYNGRVYGE
ncbi:MAG: aminoacyl-tRNA hydrolase [Cyanothece sp. SIO2G6]|nr:aminoacyl-tRNA hydrolase [Cyanothece sp. SIO2G6]